MNKALSLITLPKSVPNNERYYKGSLSFKVPRSLFNNVCKLKFRNLTSTGEKNRLMYSLERRQTTNSLKLDGT